MTKLVREACSEASLAYGDFRADYRTEAQTVERLSNAHTIAEGASDLVYADDEVLVLVRSRTDIQPAAISGRIGDMWSALADDHDELRFAEANAELETLCGSARSATWSG